MKIDYLHFVNLGIGATGALATYLAHADSGHAPAYLTVLAIMGVLSQEVGALSPSVLAPPVKP